MSAGKQARPLAAVVGVILFGAWEITAILVMTTGTRVSVPDFVHEDYGFPFTFAVHTLNTIAGPADKWSFDPGALGLDLSFWFVGTIVLLLLALYLLRRPSPRPARNPESGN